MSRRISPTLMLLSGWLVGTATVCHAQGTTALPPAPEKAVADSHSIEDLNLIGGAASMPQFADSVLGTESRFRRAMFRRGTLFRVNVLPRFADNLLDSPVSAGEQAYVGQRPTLISGVNTIFTADLRQLHLARAQLNAGVGWRWSSWQPASPNTLAVTSLYVFKRWGDRRVELKAGYLPNDLEFVGLQVGGSTSTGAVGVYAVLPNEVGLSYFPLAAPSVNIRVRATRFMYYKMGAQRSLDAAGSQSTVTRNPTGLKVLVDGNRLLLVNEGGYLRASGANTPLVWFRTGYMRNSTPYTSAITNQKTAGNYCAFVLMDYQLSMPDAKAPTRGAFVGGTAMKVPADFNAYAQYFEARLYDRGVLASRPTDVLSFVASYRMHSRYFTDRLATQGKTIWRASPSFTGTYSIHATRGHYLSLGWSYVRGAALSPRVADSLTFTANWTLYL
jgi:hypothetical protein